ncbi:MAG: MarR family winged helix-turn-helix transcriptional regulator [Firmicutes bacterium]|nr:MarR family winged helix-turn-helix transcriptional regulator [Bacillota bacterium]MDD4402620.1 MarR family winged helix-turn-helix transcriptional regulator [Desulfitobacteriaceae bacterium]
MDVTIFKRMIWDYTRKISENSKSVFCPICEQHGLTMLQVRILMELYKNKDHNIGSLADGISIAGANISAMCKKLEKKGLVVRIRDQNDERVVKVYLAKKGQDIAAQIDQAFDEKISRYVGDELGETLEDIITGLEKLNELFQKMNSI